MSPRFYVRPIAYPPAPFAVRDRHLRYTVARVPTMDAAAAEVVRREASASFTETPLRDFGE